MTTYSPECLEQEFCEVGLAPVPYSQGSPSVITLRKYFVPLSAYL